MNDYCRKMKSMADAHRDLCELVVDHTHLLNILLELNKKYDHLKTFLKRGKPFPSFLDVCNDLPTVLPLPWPPLVDNNSDSRLAISASTLPHPLHWSLVLCYHLMVAAMVVVVVVADVVTVVVVTTTVLVGVQPRAAVQLYRPLAREGVVFPDSPTSLGPTPTTCG
jgi:hypothetical protein